MAIPPRLLQHTITIEPYAGTDGYGAPTYGAAVAYPCFVDAKRRLIHGVNSQTSTGTEAMAEATAYLNRGPSIPLDSRVTLPDGRVSRVLSVLDHDGGTLPVPSHLEIVIA